MCSKLYMCTTAKFLGKITHRHNAHRLSILLIKQCHRASFAAKVAKTTPANLIEKIEHMMTEIKSLQSENEALKSKAAKEALGLSLLFTQNFAFITKNIHTAKNPFA